MRREVIVFVFINTLAIKTLKKWDTQIKNVDVRAPLGAANFLFGC